jgi:membrane-associated protease RseP (regulator of RpoE activity)
MNARLGAGTLRRAQQATVAAALLAAADIAVAQGVSAGAMPTKATIVVRGDSTRRAEEVNVVRLSARIDSLARRLNELPLNSPEYFSTYDSLQTAMQSLPRPTAFARSGTYSIQLAPTRLRTTVMDIIPQGWFGFQADGIARKSDEPTGQWVQYAEYPTVVSVEGNSPASRSGVAVGDLLLAFNGNDLRRTPVNFTRLLTPGTEVGIRLRRDGEAKDLTITVEKAPAALMVERRAQANAQAMAEGGRVVMLVDSADKRTAEMRSNAVVAAGARGGGGGSMIARTIPGRPVAAQGIVSVTPMAVGVLGAAMSAVDASLAESIVGLKGKRGVFVERVPDGSLADRIGLRRGDVILRVEKSDVASTNQLRVWLQQAEIDHREKIRLQVLRAGKTQELTYIPR